MALEAEFIYYGPTESKNKTVQMKKTPHHGWTVAIEGYPTLTRSRLTSQQAGEVFHLWYNKAQKDWGASEIHVETGR